LPVKYFIASSIPFSSQIIAVLANEAVIYYKTAMICEEKGIEEAMKYFTGTHDADEYQEFRTSMVKEDESE
jgi:hypothetical protein